MSHQIPAARPEAAMLRSMEPAGIDVGFRDLLLALVFSALGVLLMVENVNEAAENAPVAAVPVFLLVSVPLLWRRSAPLAAAAGVLAAVLLHTALFGSLIRCGVVVPRGRSSWPSPRARTSTAARPGSALGLAARVPRSP